MNRILWTSLPAIGAFIGVGVMSAFAADVPPITPSDMILGKTTAPITVIEYASMTCPHCADFEKETWPKIKSDWVETGKVRYVFRDFPLDGLALAASVVAHCLPANEYYPFTETLYDNQPAWIAGSTPVDSLKRFAKFAGMSEERFNECTNDDARKQSVVASRQSGEAAGVNSTPTFFINGTMSTGFMTYDAFAEKLNQASKKS